MTPRTRDRAAEAATISAAADRLLAGTSLRSSTGKLTVTELIAESGLRRDVVYEHQAVVEQFQGRVRAQNFTPATTQRLAEQCEQLKTERDRARKELVEERVANAALRRVVAELSLELDQARTELAAV